MLAMLWGKSHALNERGLLYCSWYFQIQTPQTNRTTSTDHTDQCRVRACSLSFSIPQTFFAQAHLLQFHSLFDLDLESKVTHNNNQCYYAKQRCGRRKNKKCKKSPINYVQESFSNSSSRLLINSGSTVHARQTEERPTISKIYQKTNQIPLATQHHAWKTQRDRNLHIRPCLCFWLCIT